MIVRKILLLSVPVALVLLLVLSFSAAVVATTNPTALERETINRHAGRAVALSADQPSPTASDIGGLGMREYRDTATGDVFDLDSRGVLRHVVNNGEMRKLNSDRVAKLTDDEYVQRARAYASEHFPEMRVDSMTVEVRRQPLGTGSDGVNDEEIVVELRQQLGGIPSCNYVRVLLNPTTGAVAMVSHDDGPVSVPTSASVTRAAALAAVSQRARMPVYSVDVCRLEAVRLPAQSPRLVWRVVIHTGDEHFGAGADAFVDALDGRLVSFGGS